MLNLLKQNDEPGSYSAPEYMSANQCNTAFETQKCLDIWSIGILIHEILTGKIPAETKFDKSLENTVYEKIIEDCLQKSPVDRIEVQELIYIFKII